MDRWVSTAHPQLGMDIELMIGAPAAVLSWCPRGAALLVVGHRGSGSAAHLRTTPEMTPRRRSRATRAACRGRTGQVRSAGSADRCGCTAGTGMTTTGQVALRMHSSLTDPSTVCHTRLWP